MRIIQTHPTFQADRPNEQIPASRRQLLFASRPGLRTPPPRRPRRGGLRKGASSVPPVKQRFIPVVSAPDRRGDLMSAVRGRVTRYRISIWRMTISILSSAISLAHIPYPISIYHIGDIDKPIDISLTSDVPYRYRITSCHSGPGQAAAGEHPPPPPLLLLRAM